MSLSAPQPLGAAHQLDRFDCGKPALTDWLQRHARQAQGSGSARTFVVCDGQRAAGYFSITVGQLDTLDAPQRLRQGMGQYPMPVSCHTANAEYYAPPLDRSARRGPPPGLDVRARAATPRFDSRASADRHLLCDTTPAILARLAVDLEYQGQGLGVGMLQDAIRRTLAIAEHAGIRALLTHPIDAQADAFYRRFGFEATPALQQSRVLLLKDARRLLG